MRRICTADCETDPFMNKHARLNYYGDENGIPQPFKWGFFDGENYLEFSTVVEFIAHIIDKDYIIYLHNGGKFDAFYLLDYIEPFSDLLLIAGRVAKFKIGDCEFRDSMNLLPTALAEFQKTEISYSLFTRDKRVLPENAAKISSYLEDDCRDLYTYVKGFIDRFGLNITLASTAMKEWQRISGLKSPNDYDGYVFENFKKYYYGGRCESLEYGIVNAPFKMVDIKSAYPWAMLQRHPYGTDHLEITLDEFNSLTRDEQNTCFITLKCISKGALPFRKPIDRSEADKLRESIELPKDSALYFPRDNVKRTYFITGWEYFAGLETNTLRDIEIDEIWYFPDQTDFGVYIHHMYNQRRAAIEEGDSLGAIFYKLLMNSLYGKYGSNPHEYHNYRTAPPGVLNKDGQFNAANDSEPDLWDFAGEFGPWILGSQKLQDNEKRFYNVATAASITGCVRAFMWRALCQCDRPLYCDTDSIAAIDLGNLPNGYGDALGQWELEGEFDYGAFGGKKLYAMRYAGKPLSKDGLPWLGKISPETLFYSVQSEEKFHSKKTMEKVVKGRGRHLLENNRLFKVASKGAKLTPAQLIAIANGEIVTYEPENPTFSVHKKPHYISRNIKMRKKYYGL